MHDPPQAPQEMQSQPKEGALRPSAEMTEPTGIAEGNDEAATVGFQPIDPRFIPAERLASLMLLIGATLGSIAAFVTMWLSEVDPIYIVLASIGLTLLCFVLLWATIFWPPMQYRHFRWRLSDVGLEIRRGVLWKSEIAIPWARAQHADVSQGPLQRMFEIGSLSIHTAGTKNSSVTIEGLSHARAIELRDEIIRQRKEHDVV